MKKRVLILYISDYSGHHRAAMAIERAFKLTAANVEVMLVNAFNYTNPILEKVINITYMEVIRRRPEFWGRMYDNPVIVKKSQRLRGLIHKYNTGKLKNLIEQFNPDAIISTQAFPCGMVADYKKSYDAKFYVFGVLTDYAPHSYWIFEKVDAYFVPSKETGERLIQNGVPANKVIDTGIPIDPVFKTVKDKNSIIKGLGLKTDIPIILIMGGSQGVGPIRDIFRFLLRSRLDVQIIAVCGKNKRLYRWLSKFNKRYNKSGKEARVYSFADNTDELMEIATFIISKPGGITTAEACVKGLPILIVDPIPGQEQMNTDFLLKNNVGIQVKDPVNVEVIMEELLYNRSKLAEIGRITRDFAKPESAENIAGFVLANI